MFERGLQVHRPWLRRGGVAHHSPATPACATRRPDLSRPRPGCRCIGQANFDRTPMQAAPNTIRSLLGRGSLYALELPALRPVSEPLRRRLFRRPYGRDNDYYGVYPTFAAAQAAANALSSRELPASYDIEAA